MQKIIFGFVFLIFSAARPAIGQITETPDAADILQGLKKLNVLGSVLYIAAHPDDENTRLLAWMSKEKNYRTGYLSLTRGDGGQNLIGDEQGIELGLIRTQELLSARRIDGAEQFFSRAFDFGFSKTTAEALRLWDENKILSDVVWVIRKFQPDVIITRFPEDRRAGHGQHSASSVLAHRAFAAAADPKQFPGQFKYGVGVWQAKRLFWNGYNFDDDNDARTGQLNLAVGGFNPLIGKSYGEVAADSRSQHRSQGFGVARSRGFTREYFSLTAGSGADSGLLDGVDASWNRVPGGAAIGTQVAGAIRAFDPSAPAASLPALLSIYAAVKALPEGYWKTQKLMEIRDLVKACSGLFLEAGVHQPSVVAGQSVSVFLNLINRSAEKITLRQTGINGHDTLFSANLTPGENTAITFTASTAGLPVSQPYWLVEPMSPASYNVDDQTMIGRPENLPALEVTFRISVGGQSFDFTEPVRYIHADPAKGEIIEPMVIVPPELATCRPEILLFRGNAPKTIEVATVGKGEAGAGPVRLTPASGFSIDTEQPGGSFAVRPTGETARVAWTRAVQTRGSRTDSLMQWRSINYAHIPRIDYFRPARTRLVATDLAITGNRVGYIEGAGDKVPEALRQMGYTVTLITELNLTAATLRNLDAVITGVRAYDVHDWLFDKYELLMDFVKNGGNLIVQYNRNNTETFRTRTGPYPFTIGGARVTEEDAAVRFLHTDDPVLRTPNAITAKDFDGWIQERGIYFAGQTDNHYRDVLSMHDNGEPDQKGSLIIAAFGKGTFTYTGLVFFRELPAGVPGAFRLLANLIAQHPQTP